MTETTTTTNTQASASPNTEWHRTPAKSAYVVRLGRHQLGLVTHVSVGAGLTMVCWRLARGHGDNPAAWTASSSRAGASPVTAKNAQALLVAIGADNLVTETVLTRCPALGGAAEWSVYARLCRDLGLAPNWDLHAAEQLDETDTYAMR